MNDCQPPDMWWSHAYTCLLTFLMDKTKLGGNLDYLSHTQSEQPVTILVEWC